MKPKTKTTLIAISLGLAANLLSGCHRTKATEVLASSPFAMDKAGAVKSIDFAVTDAHIATKRRLMVAINFPQTETMELERTILKQGIPVELEVVHIQDGNSRSIPTQDDQSAQKQPWKSEPAVSNMSLYATNGDTAYVLIAGFHPPQAGAYRATVKTIEDQPLFAGVKSVAQVQMFYNTGK